MSNVKNEKISVCDITNVEKKSSFIEGVPAGYNGGEYQVDDTNGGKTLINIHSKIFNNDSIFNLIKTSSKIIDSRGNVIHENKAYNIKSSINLHLPKKTNSVKF
ncbi:hypothetical protein BC749_11353 [Flavobacterium araucananum]|nr:hypothetical protein BC749_11353 [Flavobacterium araucananum]